MTNAADTKQWEQAESIFTNRLAARQLTEETTDNAAAPAQVLPFSIGDIRAMTGQSGTDGSPFGASSTPIPIGAIRLYRAFLAREGLAFSRHARAASSDVVTSRAIGDYQLELVLEDDALFIMITLDGNTPPSSMVLLHENGAHYTLELPSAVDDMIQQGLSRHDPKDAALVKILLDPITSITLM